MNKKIAHFYASAVLNEEMMAFTIYLNQIIGHYIYSQDGSILGRLIDLAADSKLQRPQIVAAVVLRKKEKVAIDFSAISIKEVQGGVLLFCKEMKPIDLSGKDVVFLVAQLIDKQVVDMNNTKVVTIYDLMLAKYNNQTTVAAADASPRGRLRRFRLVKTVPILSSVFGETKSNQLILWDNIEALNTKYIGPGIAKNLSKLASLHPSDMADIIEDLDSCTQAEVFSAMETERAADVFEELESDTREILLASLSAEKMADVLENMPPDEAADVLDEVDNRKANQLLQEMEDTASDKVRSLMEYEDNEVGALMTTDFICFSEDDTVESTLEALRRDKPESEMIYYLYIVTGSGALYAEVSLRDFIVSNPGTKLQTIMNTDVRFVHDTDRVDNLYEIITKYNLLAVPVVDENEKLIGIVIINDIVFNLLHSKRKRF